MQHAGSRVAGAGRGAGGLVAVGAARRPRGRVHHHAAVEARAPRRGRGRAGGRGGGQGADPPHPGPGSHPLQHLRQHVQVGKISKYQCRKYLQYLNLALAFAIDVEILMLLK